MRNYRIEYELAIPVSPDSMRNATFERACVSASSASMRVHVSSSGNASSCYTQGQGSAPSLDSEHETLSEDSLATRDLMVTHHGVPGSDEQSPRLASNVLASSNRGDRLTGTNIALKQIETIHNGSTDVHAGARSLHTWLNAADDPWTHLSSSRATRAVGDSPLDQCFKDTQPLPRATARKANKARDTRN